MGIRHTKFAGPTRAFEILFCHQLPSIARNDGRKGIYIDRCIYTLLAKWLLSSGLVEGLLQAS